MMEHSSCQLSVKAPDQTVLKGKLSMCTIEGIDTCRLPSMAFVPPGELKHWLKLDSASGTQGLLSSMIIHDASQQRFSNCMSA
jgi:hypothetical protein